MKNLTLLLVGLICLLMAAPANGQVVINEFLSSNSNANTDEDGSHEDWVEIFNTGSTAVSLDGYGLSDDGENPLKWKFPDVIIDAQSYMLIWCSDKNRTVPGSPLHTNWKISASGENLYLSDAAGNILDTSPAINLTADISYGRLPNGSGGFVIFNIITPGAANGNEGFNEILADPVFSQNSGFYTDAFELALSTNTPGATIIYTLDGSEPDEANLLGTTYNYKNQYPMNPGQDFGPMLSNTFTSNAYTAPIPIVDRTSQPNKISLISTTYDFDPFYLPTANPIFKGTVVRAKVVKPGALPSKTVTRNYFISPLGNNRFSLPVVSLSVDENKLFDYDDGIYVAGTSFDEFRTLFPTEIVNSPLGNYSWKGIAFERKTNFSYFVGGQEKINQNIGIRIQGNFSRINPSKSLNFYSRADYGAESMPYPFFSDEPYTNFVNVVLKNMSSDFYMTLFKDAMCSELAKPLHTQTEASQPVITFINGEYWGLMTLREKYDDEFFERVYGIPKDELDLLENDGSTNFIEEGDNVDYLDFINYIQNNSLTGDDNLGYIKTRMDTESFSDYYITNIFFANEDWPASNVVYWRKKTTFDPNAPYGSDGRWRWAIHDMDFACNNYNLDVLSIATSDNGTLLPNPSWSTLILRKLLENPSFKNDFISRFADLLNTAFLPSRAVAQLNQMKSELLPEMAEQIERWKAPVDIGQWYYFINNLHEFVSNRPEMQRNHIRDKFGIANNIDVIADVSGTAGGYIKINTIDIAVGTPGITSNPYPWTGIYFSDIPVKLKAVANPGYEFSHWTGASTATTDEITISSSVSFNITAVFKFPLSYTSPNIFTAGTAIAPLYPTVSVGVDTYSVSPALPEGLYLDATTGIISGTPLIVTAPATYTITATNSGGSASADVMIAVNDIPPSALSYNSPNIYTIGVAIPDLYPGYSGDNVSFTVSPALPEGLFLDQETGTITGTPTAVSLLGYYTITASNSGGSTSFDIIISVIDIPPIDLSYDTPNIFTVGTAIDNLHPNILGNVVDYSVSPPLPNGLSIDPDTGVIWGTPADVSISIHTITAENSGGSVSFDIVIMIFPPLSTGNNETDDFEIFPNPFDDRINISGITNEMSYKLFAIDGRLMDAGVVSGSQIIFNGLPRGMFFLQLTSSGAIKTVKLVKK